MVPAGQGLTINVWKLVVSGKAVQLLSTTTTSTLATVLPKESVLVHSGSSKLSTTTVGVLARGESTRAEAVDRKAVRAVSGGGFGGLTDAEAAAAVVVVRIYLE